MKFVVLALLVACQPSQTPPTPDASDASLMFDSPAFDAKPVVIDAAYDPCVSACRNLASIGCHEGTDPNCVVVCQKTRSASLTDLKLACLIAAPTKTAARSCGSVECK